MPASALDCSTPMLQTIVRCLQVMKSTAKMVESKADPRGSSFSVTAPAGKRRAEEDVFAEVAPQQDFGSEEHEVADDFGSTPALPANDDTSEILNPAPTRREYDREMRRRQLSMAKAQLALLEARQKVREQEYGLR